MPSQPRMLAVVLAAIIAVVSASSCRDLKVAYQSSACCGASLDTPTGFEVTNISQRALLVIDTQYCFLNTSTTLPVADSYRILPILNELRTDPNNFFAMHLRSQDYHPDGHVSFGPTFNLSGFYNYPNGIPMMCTEDTFPQACCPKLHANDCPTPSGSCPQYDAASIAANPACSICFPEGPTSTVVNASCRLINQAMWPVHCRSPFEGGDAGFPTGLVDRADDITIRKGQAKYMDAYSVFQDNAAFTVGTGIEAGFDFNLHERLTAAGITELYVAGLAFDFCVAWSAKDAASLGYTVTVIEDATASIGADTAAAETAAMQNVGVTITNSDSIPNRRRMKQQERTIMHGAGVKFATSADVLKMMSDSSMAAAAAKSPRARRAI